MITGKYLEDLTLGDRVTSVGRSVTETDIVFFYMFSGVYEELFINKQFIEQHSIYKKRMAQGTLTLMISVGQSMQTGWFRGTTLAFLGLDEVRTPKPVFVDDTLYTEMEVVKKRDSATYPDRGIIATKHTVTNQDGQIVMTYVHTIMVRRREPAGKTTTAKAS